MMLYYSNQLCISNNFDYALGRNGRAEWRPTKNLVVLNVERLNEKKNQINSYMHSFSNNEYQLYSSNYLSEKESTDRKKRENMW